MHVQVAEAQFAVLITRMHARARHVQVFTAQPARSAILEVHLQAFHC